MSRKKFRIICVLTIVLVVNSEAVNEADLKLLNQLNIAVQDYALMEGKVSYSNMQPYLFSINEALALLEKSENYVEYNTRIEIEEWNKVAESKIYKVLFAEYRSKYGYYTTREMLGVGSKMHFMPIPKSKIIELALIVEKDDLTRFQKLFPTAK